MSRNILVVDDSAFARSFIIRSLRICGLENAEYKEAENGEEALTIIKSGNIDLVFTDLNMPDMTGEGLLRRLKSDPSYYDLPVVVVTSLKNPAKEKNLLLNGAIVVMENSISLVQLNKIVKEKIELNKGINYEV